MIRNILFSMLIAAATTDMVNCTSIAAPGGPAVNAQQIVGGPGGKEIKPRVCKGGFVTEVYGTVGMAKLYHLEYEVITSLGMRCSDGTDLGAMGKAKGKPFSIKNDVGFTSMQVKSGAFIDQITMGYAAVDSTIVQHSEPVGGPGGTEEHTLGCGYHKIIGYAGRAHGAVDAIQVICGSDER